MKKKTPVCAGCRYMKVTGWARCNGNNMGRPRGDCMCEHPLALETFNKLYPRPHRLACFIGFTERGSNKLQIKTSPRWCPLRFQKEG